MAAVVSYKASELAVRWLLDTLPVGRYEALIYIEVTDNQNKLTIIPASQASRLEHIHRPPIQKSFEKTLLMQERNATAAAYSWEIGYLVLAKGEYIALEVVRFLGIGSLGIVQEVKSTSPGYMSFVRKQVQLPYSNRRQRQRII